MYPNYYEELIDNMMLDEVSEEDSKIKEFIKQLPLNQKRTAILSVLDKNRGMFRKIKQILDNTNVSKTTHISNVVEMIREYVTVGDVEKKKFGEVMTPISLVEEMLDTLPIEVWNNPDLKWLDPANGVGVFPSVVVKRLMDGLKEFETDEELRYKHIVENMLYVCELQPKNMFLHLCAFDPQDKYLLNVYTGSFLDKQFDEHCKNEWKLDGFDVVVGNPPYQDNLITKHGSANPLYNLFIEKSIELSNIVLSVHPNRWMAGGKGLLLFREKMLNSNNIVLIKTFNDSTPIFGKNVNIEGGVQYLLFNKSYSGLCKLNGTDVKLNMFDIIVELQYQSIVEKVVTYSKFLSDICVGQSYCGITSNDSRLVKVTDSDKFYFKCYVSQHKGFVSYIEQNKVKSNISNLSGYKIYTARANGSSKKFGNKFIANPYELCTQSYISFHVNNKTEAENLLDYMNTKFCNFLLGLRKISQDIKPDTCKWIPLIPLNRTWTDEMLYKHFNLTQCEINLIETTF